MEVYTPQILWHGGGSTKGKPERVFSVDVHPKGVLATTGYDENVPPKGCTRIWELSEGDFAAGNWAKCITQFNDHQSDCHVARFSPCGRWLASASDRTIMCYEVKKPEDWLELTDENRPRKVFLSTSLTEIYDLQWSADSRYVLAGSMNNRAQILEVATKLEHPLCGTGHTHYVQGVAWDPLNEIIATQSADRSTKLYFLKKKPRSNKAKAGTERAAAMASAPVQEKVKFSRVATIKMIYPPTAPNDEAATLAEADAPPVPEEKKIKKGSNLYADSTVESFFRRPAFSPDGALFVTPTGLHKKEVTGEDGTSKSSMSFATHVFSRRKLKERNPNPTPTVTLPGLEDPSVSVSFCPRLFELVERNGESSAPLFAGAYRMVFAVATTSTVFVYDTQHQRPIGRLGGLHCTNINDVTWSADGTKLFCCSSDGYVSLVTFADGALGRALSETEHEKYMVEMRRIDEQDFGVNVASGEGNAVIESTEDDVEPVEADENVPPPPGRVKTREYQVAAAPSVEGTVNTLTAKPKKRLAPVAVVPDAINCGVSSPQPTKAEGAAAPPSSEKRRRIAPVPVNTAA